MKRFIIALVIFLIIPFTACGEDLSEEGYNEILNSYDLSFFEDSLDESTYDFLKTLEIEDFSFENLYNLSVEDLRDIILKIAKDKLNSPLQGLTAVLAFILLSSMVQSLKNDGSDATELYSFVSSLIISLILLVKISPTVTLATLCVKVSANFIYAFIPVFCAIVAASGGITVSFSTNATLLMLSQLLSFIASNIFIPVINCFLALGICSSLRPQLGLGRLIENLRRGVTSAMSVIAGGYVSVLSLKTTAASRVDAMGLRSLRFVVSSVVPVIGGALNEGLVSIQAYSSLIKSSVGIVGIISVTLVFLPSVIEVTIWRVVLNLCSSVSDVFNDVTVSTVLKSFSSVMLIINVLLIMCALTTVVSIGVLIASGG